MTDNKTSKNIRFSEQCPTCGDIMTIYDSLNGYSMKIRWYKCCSCNTHAEHDISKNELKFYQKQKGAGQE